MKCRFCGVEKDTKPSLIGHETRCKSNPDRKVSLGNTGKAAWNRGKTKDTDEIVALAAIKMKKRKPRDWTEAERKKLSASMQLAHKEGRAWNIGMNRWKKTPSYPEHFFSMVINNHFDDTNFEREVWYKGFVLDFLWRAKKLVIEVDGKQHDAPAQKERDNRKDALLVADGYKVLRIRWDAMTKNPEVEIKRANKFIGSVV